MRDPKRERERERGNEDKYSIYSMFAWPQESDLLRSDLTAAAVRARKSSQGGTVGTSNPTWLCCHISQLSIRRLGG